MARKVTGDSPAAALARMRAESLTPEERSDIASKGGKAAAANMTEAQRKARAAKAIAARWGTTKRKSSKKEVKT